MTEQNEIFYHGSNAVVDNPIIQISGYYKDFGYGFYCTRLEKQAVRWALTSAESISSTRTISGQTLPSRFFRLIDV